MYRYLLLSFLLFIGCSAPASTGEVKVYPKYLVVDHTGKVHRDLNLKYSGINETQFYDYLKNEVVTFKGDHIIVQTPIGH